MPDQLIYTLLFWNVLQMTFFVWQIQKLVNKLMSRDFYDYQRGAKYEFPKDEVKPGQVLAVKADELDLPPPKDLGF